MTAPIALSSRALVAVRGEPWREFLQNLLTQDIESLQDGEARFAALLTPQGRLLYDLFVIADGEGCLLDVEAAWREALIQRLLIYRLRAKVEITADERPVSAILPHFNGGGGPRSGGGGAADTPAPGPAPPPPLSGSPSPASRGRNVQDPRLSALGHRAYGHAGSESEAAYDAHRLALGVPGPADWGTDKTYPLEADFDLLNGVDFQKGCFVGQETTSRMKRRGAIKTRMLPIDYQGDQIAPGTEILAGTLRAGEVLSGMAGRSMALVRLDRIEGQLLTAGDRPVTVVEPGWYV